MLVRKRLEALLMGRAIKRKDWHRENLAIHMVDDKIYFLDGRLYFGAPLLHPNYEWEEWEGHILTNKEDSNDHSN